ncbi:hypothetical protein AC477_03280 [miscellaneous Crenarchaeota group-1 archaeon SG8-32-1]|uniref:8-oxo-dGTP diphosphatase n=1 Tax=miscellaneous Crenarchaeota group-1 archaeon SG8-32-1 TaxID=1685124 RepID=A0A0M0BUB3_9ARCH|nr:MAG: hypothetical protein AC477_03280 [miscellaneous Crenarchaeota group-1 archaeon SG8-32-1]
MEAVDVVVGIVVKGKEFLVERRRWDETIDPGIVCLPAGHVKSKEDLGDALKREMMEELGIKVNEMEFVCKNFYIASNGEKQNAYCYIITKYEGDPICKAAQEIFWEDDVNNMSLEIDKKTIRKMKELQENIQSS